MNRPAASSHRPPSLPPLTRLLWVLSLLSCSSVNGVELISTTDPSKCLWLSAPSGSYTLSHDCTYSGAYEAAAQDAILDATKKAALTSAFSHYLPIMTVSAPFTVIGAMCSWKVLGTKSSNHRECLCSVSSWDLFLGERREQH